MTTAARTAALTDLVAAVPFMLGFHPSDSVVVIMVRGGSVVLAGRHDLPGPDQVAAQAETLALAITRHDPDFAFLFGYGPEPPVSRALPAFGAALRSAHVPVLDEVRVTGDRFYAYHCADEACCPSLGWPVPPKDSVVAARATFNGQVALPSRAQVVERVAAVTGPARVAMAGATIRAQQRMAELHSRGLNDVALARLLRRVGRTAVRQAETVHQSGRPLDDDLAAWLGVVLLDDGVREYAMGRLASPLPWHTALWCDVTRRVGPLFVPGAACLLSYAAWRAGDGVLANVALDRALATDPDFPMALLMNDILSHAVSPAETVVVPAGGGPVP